ncbi:MAG: hypothetical protein GXO64_00555 [Candidatus Micrarchaeota archaeon]|nr:hypothetical protein [Candidatus Micrarchaeota archaeon]
MVDEKNLARIVILIAIAAVILIASFSGVGIFGKDKSISVSWDIAVTLLHNGEVEKVAADNGSIFMSLKNGKVVSTTEPYEGAIFDEIRKCADACKGIII